jgi:AcrR family transcriptional regulator
VSDPRPPIPDIGAIGGADLTEKHREVLREAMRLFAERGFRGASLRELARRVGMQQPSLYHYFRSKDELVEQILVTFGFGGVGATPNEGQLPERVEDYPALLAAIVTWLYDHTEWPVFVRFMFNLSLESPKHQKRLREMFVETTASQMHAVVGYYVTTGQIGEIDGEHLTRMVLSAVALPLIEERLLFPSAGSHRGLADYIAFVVRFAKAGVPAMTKSDGVALELPVVRSKLAETRPAPDAKPERPALKAKAPPPDLPRGRRTRAPGRPKER